MTYTHRIRRCDGNRDAWLLVALLDDGTEMTTFGSYTTALSIDDLLRHSGSLLPMPGDVVEILYFEPDYDDPTLMRFIAKRRAAEQHEAWCCLTVTAAWDCPTGETYTASANLGGVSLDAGQYAPGEKVALVAEKFARDSELYTEALEALNERLREVICEAADIVAALRDPKREPALAEADEKDRA